MLKVIEESDHQTKSSRTEPQRSPGFWLGFCPPPPEKKKTSSACRQTSIVDNQGESSMVLGVGSPFFATIVIFKKQLIPLGF